ncbi:chalcone synthase 8-like [Diospyros lotus]|uniref:chalcone synthase 8-like n=1 Tax=Diospyros lotus TaxID=55363 RepID=UPI00225A67FA|nr:chalcone synthase 8-like [Diospyros lotus]
MAEAQRPNRPKGRAMVLAIGTATPANVVNQADYPDFYFRVTNSEHLTDLKKKFKQICENTTIKKRHLHLTEEMLNDNPKIISPTENSVNARQEITVAEVPKLAEEASRKAIEEWKKPLSKITHIVFCTTSTIDMPGPDWDLMNLLGMDNTVQRFVLSQQGCSTGATVLRLSKDIAENNPTARVLAVCSDVTVPYFRGPSGDDVDDLLVGQALFGDGAAAMIIGSEPDPTEHPVFEIASATQVTVPNTRAAIDVTAREAGFIVHLSKELPGLLASNIEKCLEDAFVQKGISDWNSLFWIPHPGGPAILDKIESKLGLKREKLALTREVLREYGNMVTPSVVFVMDEMRKRSSEQGKASTGEGLEWGVLFGYGPGLVLETVVLRALPTGWTN